MVGLALFCCTAVIKQIADRTDTLEKQRFFGIFLEVLAEPDDEIIHRTGRHFTGVALSDLQNLGARQGFSAVFDKKFQ